MNVKKIKKLVDSKKSVKGNYCAASGDIVIELIDIIISGGVTIGHL